MNEDGYTLVEMLAALAILSLAMAGLGEGANLIGRQSMGANAKLEDATSLSRTQRGLDRVIEIAEQGAIRRAGARELEFSCEDLNACLALTRADLDLLHLVRVPGTNIFSVRPPDGMTFEYRVASGEMRTWSADASDEPLRSIVLRAPTGVGGAAVMAIVALRDEQPFKCRYDVIGMSCYGEAE